MLFRMLCSGCAGYSPKVNRVTVKASMLQCVQMHWRALRQAFKTSCYHLDPEAEKRKLLRHRDSLEKTSNMHFNKC